MRRSVIIFVILLNVLLGSILQCNESKKKKEEKIEKVVVYQMLPRLFGNTRATNKSWGTIEENGVGKFNDINDKALEALSDFGVTHVWYTGVLHHAVINDYSEYGISRDDPDVVKGRAGSPYAVKDYYNVNPDLAVDPANRLAEFEALIRRTHRHGLKVIIDIVPNHVARNYESVSAPEGVKDFGADDNKNVVYHRNNNFYYLPGRPFKVPEWPKGYLPLGGERHPLADGVFDEDPAKWSGNGSRNQQPKFDDWYETVKVNYGVKPDGTYDFETLPTGFENELVEVHYAFWKEKDVPDSWVKFKDIALYWIGKGVDGFRYDMAQMVPVEFWSYMNSAIKKAKPDAFLLSEIYVPEMYHDYIFKGKMDYLYDKVELYDALKNIIMGKGSTDHLPAIFEGQKEISHHMLHFMENHDELRLGSPEFAGDAAAGKPAMVVSATATSAPVMVYFGQEVGEKGAGNPGFGSPWRTTIFDYWGVSSHQRWMNEGKFDGGQLSSSERSLRDFYQHLLNYKAKSDVLTGKYAEIHRHNREHSLGYNDRLYSFLRWKDKDRLLVVTNFDKQQACEFDLHIPQELLSEIQLKVKTYRLRDQLGSDSQFELQVTDSSAMVTIDLQPLESYLLSF
ncbi:MAG: alpha-amylase family glycosyl hydrolase [Bacteroidales bacterium]